MTDVKKIILARRARFIAAAVAGVGFLPGCGGDAESKACLSMALVPDGGDGGDAETDAQACLKISPDGCLAAPWDGPEEDSEPQVCLQPDDDAGPQVCLQPDEDAGPGPCLQPPLDADAPEACLSPPYDPDAG